MTASAAPAPAPNPAPSPARASDPAPNPAPAPAPAAADWTAGLSPEHLSYVQTKKYDSPGAVVAARIAAEKLLGVPAENILKLPTEDTPEAWATIHDRLGRPKSAGEYGLEKMLPEGHDATFAKTAGEWLHKAGLNTKQAQAITGEWNKYVADQQAVAVAKRQETDAVQRVALKAEWAGEFDNRFKIAKGAAERFGMSEPQLQALSDTMGPAMALKFLHNIGAKLGVEPDFVQGDRQVGFNGLTPDDAKAKIKAAQNDLGWQKKWKDGDAAARKEYRDWHNIAYPAANVSPFEAKVAPRT